MQIARALVVAGVTALFAVEAAFAQQSHAPTPPEQLGKVYFPTSCSPAVGKQFDRALALLHSFWAKDAIQGFNAVLQQDPDCAIAYWGIAMSAQQNPLTGQEPNASATKDALAGLDRAKAIGAKTQRERDYLAAVDLIYRDAVGLKYVHRFSLKTMNILVFVSPFSQPEPKPKRKARFAVFLFLRAALHEAPRW